MNRVALTVPSPNLDVEVEPRFGRAAYLLLVDPGSMACEVLANPGRDAEEGAGIRVAQVLSDREVSDVISGEFGPKAHDALKAAGISMHRCGSDTTAREAVGLLKDGKLGRAELATGPGWGGGSGRGSGGGRRWRGRGR